MTAIPFVFLCSRFPRLFLFLSMLPDEIYDFFEALHGPCDPLMAEGMAAGV